MKNKSILVIDDEEILLATISRTLRKQGYIVTTALNGEEGLQKFNENPSDLILTDLVMEGEGGIQLSREIKKIEPATEVIVLTGYPTTASAIDALRLGACDYLLKPCEREELLQSVSDCLQQQENQTLAERKIFNLNRFMNKAGLTSRETEVCHLIKEGMSNTEISSKLNISLNTTKNHVKQIHEKLQVTKRAQLVALLAGC